MKLNKKEIITLAKKYDDCKIEELYENHQTMGNYVCITCKLNTKEDENSIIVEGGIFSLLNDLNAYDNIDNLYDETFDDDDGGFFEYVTFEWE